MTGASTELTLYFHPLSSYCQKVLMALYENETLFTPRLVDLADPASSAELRKIWPIGKFPVLRDAAKDCVVPESSIIIEYLALHYPGRAELLPADAERARQTRLRDRFFDLHVCEPMSKVVTDRLRPPGKNDPHGVKHARAMLQTACGMIDRDMAARTWAMGEAISMADCAAAPALFYANLVMPLHPTFANAAAYLDRLQQRPSFARVVEEAAPYRALFPSEPQQ
jgi:glutathione S-transferase